MGANLHQRHPARPSGDDRPRSQQALEAWGPRGPQPARPEQQNSGPQGLCGWLSTQPASSVLFSCVPTDGKRQKVSGQRARPSLPPAPAREGDWAPSLTGGLEPRLKTDVGGSWAPGPGAQHLAEAAGWAVDGRPRGGACPIPAPSSLGRPRQTQGRQRPRGSSRDRGLQQGQGLWWAPAARLPPSQNPPSPTRLGEPQASAHSARQGRGASAGGRGASRHSAQAARPAVPGEASPQQPALELGAPWLEQQHRPWREGPASSGTSQK